MIENYKLYYLKEQLKDWIKYPNRKCMYICKECPFRNQLYHKCKIGLSVSEQRQELSKIKLYNDFGEEDLFEILL